MTPGRDEVNHFDLFDLISITSILSRFKLEYGRIVIHDGSIGGFYIPP